LITILDKTCPNKKAPQGAFFLSTFYCSFCSSGYNTFGCSPSFLSCHDYFLLAALLAIDFTVFGLGGFLPFNI
jgi:hypothetical protein